MCVKSLQLCPTLCDPMGCSPPDSSAMGCSKQEDWSGLLYPLPGVCPNPGIEPMPWQTPLVNNIAKNICGRESWTIKKAECQRIGAFELWCRRRLLRVPWTARRFNQSILKEIRSEYSLEGLMPKLKLQYFGHLMGRTDSLKKDPNTGHD